MGALAGFGDTGLALLQHFAIVAGDPVGLGLGEVGEGGGKLAGRRAAGRFEVLAGSGGVRGDLLQAAEFGGGGQPPGTGAAALLAADSVDQGLQRAAAVGAVGCGIGGGGGEPQRVAAQEVGQAGVVHAFPGGGVLAHRLAGGVQPDVGRAEAGGDRGRVLQRGAAYQADEGGVAAGQGGGGQVGVLGVEPHRDDAFGAPAAAGPVGAGLGVGKSVVIDCRPAGGGEPGLEQGAQFALAGHAPVFMAAQALLPGAEQVGGDAAGSGGAIAAVVASGLGQARGVCGATLPGEAGAMVQRTGLVRSEAGCTGGCRCGLRGGCIPAGTVALAGGEQEQQGSERAQPSVHRSDSGSGGAEVAAREGRT